MRNVLLVCTAVALLGLAGWQMFRKRAENVHPDTAESVTEWICDSPCGEVIHLTSKVRDEWARSDDKVRRGVASKQTVFLCPKCGKFTAVRAMKCPKHDIWIAVIHADGRDGTCPLCDKEGGS